MQDSGWDHNKRRKYELARLVASRLVAEPGLVENARRYLTQHVKSDPSQRHYYELWSGILQLDAGEIAARLLADDAEGSQLRDSRPVFYVPSNAERKAAFARARQSAPK